MQVKNSVLLVFLAWDLVMSDDEAVTSTNLDVIFQITQMKADFWKPIGLKGIKNN